MRKLLLKEESLDRKRWRLFCHGHPFGDITEGNNASETIDRSIYY